MSLCAVTAYLALAHRGRERAELAVDVAILKAVAVDDGQLPDSHPAKRFRRVAAHAAETENHYV